MARFTMRQLRDLVGGEELQQALVIQNAQRRSGDPVQPLAAILGVTKPRKKSDPKDTPVDLTARQLTKRGTYGKAALLADQAALAERDLSRQADARRAAKILKDLSEQPQQIEFSFWEGNVSIAHDYHDAVLARLRAEPKLSIGRRMTALAILGLIVKNLGWQTYASTITAAEISDLLGVDKSNVSRALQTLESIGAITRLQRGRQKIIAVNPEAAYRGNVNEHHRAVAKYRSEVLQFRRDKHAPKLDQPEPADAG